jgi:hypothetical protein
MIPHATNWELIALFITIALWPVVFVSLLAYDCIKKNKFRPVYRAAWPFILIGEILS